MSNRVTPATASESKSRTINWIAIILVTLVLVGLVGGYFMSFVASDPTITTSTSSSLP